MRLPCKALPFSSVKLLSLLPPIALTSLLAILTSLFTSTSVAETKVRKLGTSKPVLATIFQIGVSLSATAFSRLLLISASVYVTTLSSSPIVPVIVATAETLTLSPSIFELSTFTAALLPSIAQDTVLVIVDASISTLPLALETASFASMTALFKFMLTFPRLSLTILRLTSPPLVITSALSITVPPFSTVSVPVKLIIFSDEATKLPPEV